VIEVHLFGELRQYAVNPAPVPGTVLQIPEEEGLSVGQVLARLGIEADQVGNVFLNGRLLPRSTYPLTLGYPLAAKEVLTLDDCLAAPVRSGDRLGIFPPKMSLVVV